MTAEAPRSNAHRARMAARRRYGDDQVNSALERGARQYVIMGAKADTYAYRNRNPNLPVFEVAPADLEVGTLPAALEAAGFQTGQVSFFSWLGISPCSSAQATLEALAFIGSLPTGSGLAFDYAVRRTLLVPGLDPNQETAMDALASRITAQGEPLQLSIDSHALHEFLRFTGFHEVEDLGPTEIEKRYCSDREDGLRVWPGPAHLVSARV
jgi:O-methyltransferase involved in polyketide biosynthesis